MQPSRMMDAIHERPGEIFVPRPSASVAPRSAEDPAAERFREVLATIPKRFREHRLGTVGVHVKRPEALTEARSALEGLLAGEVLAVTLFGPSEAGKTSLAASLVAELVELALDQHPGARRLLSRPLWTDALALSRARSTTKLGDGEAPLVERANLASLLVVDELGGETVAGSDEVLDVIWRRWQDERPTLVTTGQNRERLRLRYGDGIVTRLTRQAQSRAIGCAIPKEKRPARQALPLEGPSR